MKKLILGYCPVGHGNSPFDDVFDLKQDVSKHGFDGVDAVVFWGGTDIHPSLFKHSTSARSQAGEQPSHRDMFEWAAMKYCKANRIPMIGVCRGAQMLCAAAGGWLIQHMHGHNCGQHPMITSDGVVMNTTSAHHQLMYPYDVNHVVLATSTERLSNLYLDGTDSDVDMKGKPEIEVCWFPDIRGLAIQGHPEWVANESDFALYCNDLIREYILELVDIAY
jgi:anthranilate/para-aminobenzoate synthase component II